MDGMMEIKKKRRVMVGTPCYDGSIDVWYVNSLVNTVKLAAEMNVEIIPIWVSYDALVQRARNDTIALVRELDCDDIIFIDNDIEWEPEWFYRLLNYPVDIVGGTYPKKGEAELYVAKMDDPYAAKDPVTNLLEVDGLGTGFLRFSRRAVDAIWDASPVYVELDQQKDRRWVFEVVVENVVGCGKREVVVEGGFNIPRSSIEFPVEVFEKVNNWFEGIVGMRFRSGDSVGKIRDKSFVLVVEKKISS
jgi:glycosyltransferase involved in cell wall biosynthesis